MSILPHIPLRMEETNSIPYPPEILRVISYQEICAEAGVCVFPSALLFKEVSPVSEDGSLRQICFSEVPAPR